MSERRPRAGGHSERLALEHVPEAASVTEAEMHTLDVDLDRVWSGITGELWATQPGWLERRTASLLGSLALARALVTTPSLWAAWLLASAVVFALGAFVTWQTEQPLIALIAPALAGIGVSFAYGAGADPAYEISRTMPTSSRMILLVRVVVVFAVNALLGLIASLFAPAMTDLTLLWLLPMVAMALLGLAVATLTCSATAGGATSLIVWGAIVLAAELNRDDRMDPSRHIDPSQYMNAVSSSTLADAAPMYLMLACASALIVVWKSSENAMRRDGLGWR